MGLLRCLLLTVVVRAQCDRHAAPHIPGGCFPKEEEAAGPRLCRGLEAVVLRPPQKSSLCQSRFSYSTVPCCIRGDLGPTHCLKLTIKHLELEMLH